MAHTTPLKVVIVSRFQRKILPTQWDCWVQGELFPPLSAVHAGQGLIYTAVFEISGPCRCICFVLISKGAKFCETLIPSFGSCFKSLSISSIILQSGFVNHHQPTECQQRRDNNIEQIANPPRLKMAKGRFVSESPSLSCSKPSSSNLARHFREILLKVRG